jgi:glycerate 2-kinase
MAGGVRTAGAKAAERPVADGGDGTLDVLVAAAGPGGSVTAHGVIGALGGRTSARLGWISRERAVVEMAEASGLRKVTGRLDALAATTYGAGELIAAAVDGGARSVIVGVGGSATTDGGAGLLQALGARLLDARGVDLEPGGGALIRLERIDFSGLRPDLVDCRIEVATDVRSPLLGSDGAARVFGPQKGASLSDVALLEAALHRLAEVAERDLGAAGLADSPGAGAAGGAAYGLALIGAELRPGAELVCDAIGLDAFIADASLVLTGEGRLDAQTASGKAPSEVAERSRRHGVACVAIAGTVEDPLAGVFDAVYSLSDLAGTGDPRENARRLIKDAACLAVSRFLPS